MQVYTIGLNGKVEVGTKFELLTRKGGGIQPVIFTGSKGSETETDFFQEIFPICCNKTTQALFASWEKSVGPSDRINYARISETGLPLIRDFDLLNICQRRMVATTKNTVDHSVICVFEFTLGRSVPNYFVPLTGGIVGSIGCFEPIFAQFPGDIVSNGLIKKNTESHVERSSGIRRLVTVIRKGIEFCVRDMKDPSIYIKYMWNGEMITSQIARTYK
jgi:hypothetical protein